MQTKLTLRLDADLVALAKAHAQEEGKSLSRMVADYFRLLTTRKEESDEHLPPVVRSLKGALKGTGLDKEDYHRYLEEKYLGE